MSYPDPYFIDKESVNRYLKLRKKADSLKNKIVCPKCHTFSIQIRDKRYHCLTCRYHWE